MMREDINRVSEGLAAWRSREERFEKIFPGTLQNNRPFLIEKLDYLDNLQAMYGRSANENERITLRILKTDRDRLAKTVYPNVFLRFFRNLLLPLRQRRVEKQSETQATSNIATIEKSLKDNGFGQCLNRIQSEMAKNGPQFSMPVSYYVTEKERMDFTLSFAKDDIGVYQFTGFHGCLNSGQNKEQRQHHFQFDNDNHIPTAEQAYNLLAGRAICMAGEATTGKQSWQQFDLNDKDTSGNYRLKLFPSDYGYDLAALVKQLPFKEDISSDKVAQLIRSLEQGKKQEITINRDNQPCKYFINANPQFRTLLVHDEQGKKVSLASLSKPDAPKQAQPKIVKLNQPKSKRKGLAR